MGQGGYLWFISLVAHCTSGSGADAVYQGRSPEACSLRRSAAMEVRVETTGFADEPM